MSLTEKNDSRLDQLLKGFGEFKKKNYFGGYCLIVDNVIVGLALDGLLYLRGCLLQGATLNQLNLNG